MSDTVRSATGRQRLRMCADAFLLAGLLFVLTQGALALLATALGLDEGAPPDWIGLLSPLLAVAAVVAGAVGSWRLHGRPLSRPAWAGLALGAVLGGPLASAGFMAVAGLSQLVPWPGPRRSEGPWVAVGLLTLVVVAFLALPVVDAVRDLAGARTSVLADRVRLAALLLTLAVVAVTTAIGVARGDETGEVGVFLVLVAVPAATAVLGADLVLTSRARRRDASAGEPPDVAPDVPRTA
ncbi:hypothetical protein [Cellulomonas soli]|uniref:Uncharacterized protein n=1 Tax=Cellulomonas soli TaxID=931535 RepID=A0A512PBW5_9CELL|nr:hypothetical protein [Cellulomonas soli]NYI58279.1 hypothetical protein [Cellulomonas soli]GEP68699.1 hypothetical protein CSO01_14140 [Cellulomonas soli]